MSNEAAERLLVLAKEAEKDPNVWNTEGYHLAESVIENLDAALAAERKGTVERIRARILDRVEFGVTVGAVMPLHDAFAILEAEAAP